MKIPFHSNGSTGFTDPDTGARVCTGSQMGLTMPFIAYRTENQVWRLRQQASNPPTTHRKEKRMKTLTSEQLSRLNELKAADAAHEAACDKFSPRKRNGSRSITPDEQAQISAVAPFTNELRAELETLLFLSTPAGNEFVYPSSDLRSLTGFMGNVLAHVTSLGCAFKSNMGDTRRTVRATGIDGARYVGTIYGTYCRIRPTAQQLQPTRKANHENAPRQL